MIYFIKINLKFFLLVVVLLYKNVNGASQEPLNFSYDDFTIITGDEAPMKESKPKPKKQEPSTTTAPESPVESGKSYLDEFFDKSLQTFDNVKRAGSKILEDINAQREAPPPKPAPKENLAKNFPDPFFYDAIYVKNNNFITYAYIYNDKTNKDNSYIPRISNYKIEVELLSLAKSKNNREKFYELFNASREDKTFDINYQDKFGNTMLLTALRNGNFEIFYFLLSQNANPNVCNNARVCAIHIGVHAYSIDIVKALCRVNADITIKDINDITPMQFAIFNDSEEIFDELLKRYLRYPVNKSDREDLLYFANEGNFVKYYKKMKRVF